MKACYISYIYKTTPHTIFEGIVPGWESKFELQVIRRIESLCKAGAIITNVNYIELKEN